MNCLPLFHCNQMDGEEEVLGLPIVALLASRCNFAHRKKAIYASDGEIMALEEEPSIKSDPNGLKQLGRRWRAGFQEDITVRQRKRELNSPVGLR